MTDNELEKTLWAAADKMRSNMDAAEYKHIVLGLIFLKYISDSFNDLFYKLVEGKGEYEGADAEDPDEYLGNNVFFVPETARWQYLQDRAKQPEIGKFLDDAMDAIERINAPLKGVLPKIYADPELNKQRLGELIDLIGTIGFQQDSNKSQDLLGRVYEYFLGQFADAEGKKGGQFYTPASIVKLLVEMIEPFNGRVYDGCCGSGGMFVQSEKFVINHQGNIKDLSIFGQESNPTTLRLARMNLAIRGIDAKLELGDTFLNDRHPDLKADFILANPPFNISDWNGEQLRQDQRWKYGPPPVGNANYAWLQHYINKLCPTGTAGIVLASSSLSSPGSEAEIRKAIINAGLVDCIVELPSHLFYNTLISACLWFIARDRKNQKYRNRSNEILFIDAHKLGIMDSRTQKELSENDIQQIAETYHNWRSLHGNFQDIDGFCRSISIEKIQAENYVLSPSRYIPALEQETPELINFKNQCEKEKFEKLRNELINSTSLVADSWKNEIAVIKVNDSLQMLENVNRFKEESKLIYESLIKSYFIDYELPRKTELIDSNLGRIPKGWEIKEFGDLFFERKQYVDQLGYCPKVFSVTNLGIQPREDNFSKTLSANANTYKIANYGDMVFGLSREIPNFDVLMNKEGAFSPAYSIYQPKDIRFGLIVGGIMRIKLMEQTDILKGGAREGRTLDKTKLGKKLFALPPQEMLEDLWGSTDTTIL
jgi:type I restriction enzyme M protein